MYSRPTDSESVQVVVCLVSLWSPPPLTETVNMGARTLTKFEFNSILESVPTFRISFRGKGVLWNVQIVQRNQK